jgi:Domain of unknown function (DUF4873)
VLVPDEDPDVYRGPAVLSVDGRDVPVHVVLDARHEPHDGRLRWFGRLTLDDPGPDAPPELTRPDRRLVLRAGGVAAPASLGDVDPWGRYRVTGVGRPPFARPDPDLTD